MVCHVCGKGVEHGDRFCNSCGASLEGVIDTPAVADADVAGDTGDTETTGAPEPAAETTGEAIGEADPTEAIPATPEPATPPDTQQLPTEAIPAVGRAVEESPEPADDEPAPETTEDWDIDPVWAPTGTVLAQAGVATGDLPSTEPITEVWMDTVAEGAIDAPDAVGQATPYDFAEQEPVTRQTEVMQQTATAEMPALAAPAADPHRFRFGAVTLFGIIGGIVTLVSLFANVLSVTSDTRLVLNDDTPFGFRTGEWIVDDLADNLSIAGLIAALLMVAGGVAAAFGWRWGSGMAGGAGLGFAGIASIAVGLAQIPIDAAHEMARIPSEEQFVLTITRDLGYWLLIAAGAIGIVLFFASINDALGDRRPGLNPWVAALGALAAVVTAAGPLIPENQAVFSDNWYLVEAPGEPPALLLAGRLVQLGLLAFTGVVGFLSVRRWGLGLAIGGSLPIVWLAASTLFELGDNPIGPGFRNPGATDMHLHGVTIIGVSALAAMSVLSVIAAYDQGTRERR